MTTSTARQPTSGSPGPGPAPSLPVGRGRSVMTTAGTGVAEWLGSPANGPGLSARVIGSSPGSEPGGALCVCHRNNCHVLAKKGQFTQLAGARREKR